VRAPQPAVMGVGTVRSETGVNRRQIERDGRVVLGQNPWGVCDSTMTVLSFAAPDGKPLLNLAHYGAHPTSAFLHPFVSRDWPGVMLDILERETGAPAAFLQGTSGDTGPRIANNQTIGGDAYVREIGSLAGLDAMRAFRGIKTRLATSVKIVSGELALPLRERIPLQEAREKLARAKAGSRDEDYYGRVVKSYDETRGQECPRHLKLPQTLLALGDVVFVPFPFETFSEISLRLRAYSPFQHTLCVTDANGSNGYLPTQGEWARGGYEVEVARTEGVWPWVDDLDTQIIQENLKLLETLKCTA